MLEPVAAESSHSPNPVSERAQALRLRVPGASVIKFRRDMIQALSLGFAILLVGCAGSSSKLETINTEPCTDLDRNFIVDVEPWRATDEADLAGIALTLPIFEVAPDHRRDWVYSTGILRKTDHAILYKCDGAGPAPRIRLLRADRPVLIEVSFPTSNHASIFYFRRTAGGWIRMRDASIIDAKSNQ